jgi:hypothetical protein
MFTAVLALGNKIKINVQGGIFGICTLYHCALQSGIHERCVMSHSFTFKPCKNNSVVFLIVH